MNFFIFRIRLIWISFQINSCPVEYLLFLNRDNISSLKFFRISLILEKDCPYFSERQLIKQCNKLCQTCFLECSTQPLYICAERNSHSSADQGGVW